MLKGSTLSYIILKQFSKEVQNFTLYSECKQQTMTLDPTYRLSKKFIAGLYLCSQIVRELKRQVQICMLYAKDSMLA